MIEVKEHKGASIPLTAIPQYTRLLEYQNIDNVIPGVLIWLSEKDKLYWVDIKELHKVIQAGHKSVGVKIAESALYNILEVPATKKRTFLEGNYKTLVEWAEQNYNKEA